MTQHYPPQPAGAFGQDDSGASLSQPRPDQLPPPSDWQYREQYQPPHVQPSAAPSAQHLRWSNRALAAAAAVGIIIGVGGVFGAAAIGEAISSASATTVRGTLALNDYRSAGGAYATGKECAGTGGYDDIRQGAAVTVKNADGTVVGTGNLSAGQSDGAGTCNFTFAVADVPNSEFYAIEVSHRGSMTYSSDDVRAGNVSLSLGT